MAWAVAGLRGGSAPDGGSECSDVRSRPISASRTRTSAAMYFAYSDSKSRSVRRSIVGLLAHAMQAFLPLVNFFRSLSPLAWIPASLYFLVNGVPKFEVHMGPRREFAIFDGVQDEHRAHESPANLLRPYRLEVEGNFASHEWKIPSLNMVFTVTLSGGSRGDCESWYVLLVPAGKPKPSH